MFCLWIITLRNNGWDSFNSETKTKYIKQKEEIRRLFFMEYVLHITTKLKHISISDSSSKCLSCMQEQTANTWILNGSYLLFGCRHVYFFLLDLGIFMSSKEIVFVLKMHEVTQEIYSDYVYATTFSSIQPNLNHWLILEKNNSDNTVYMLGIW